MSKVEKSRFSCYQKKCLIKFDTQCVRFVKMHQAVLLHAIFCMLHFNKNLISKKPYPFLVRKKFAGIQE